MTCTLQTASCLPPPSPFCSASSTNTLLSHPSPMITPPSCSYHTEERYFSAQTHRVVPRASPSSKAGSRASDSQGSTSSSDTVSGRILLGTRRECGPPQRQDDEDGEDGVRGLSRLLADHQRGPWDSSTYGAEAIYSGDVTGVVPEDAFPAFL